VGAAAAFMTDLSSRRSEASVGIYFPEVRASSSALKADPDIRSRRSLLRDDNEVVRLRLSVTSSASFAMPFGTAISDGLSLNSLQLTASSALASGLVAYSVT
jgi:hypothetical protein